MWAELTASIEPVHLSLSVCRTQIPIIVSYFEKGCREEIICTWFINMKDFLFSKQCDHKIEPDARSFLLDQNVQLDYNNLLLEFLWHC